VCVCEPLICRDLARVNTRMWSLRLPHGESTFLSAFLASIRGFGDWQKCVKHKRNSTCQGDDLGEELAGWGGRREGVENLAALFGGDDREECLLRRRRRG